jgi:hypothetical protein
MINNNNNNNNNNNLLLLSMFLCSQQLVGSQKGRGLIGWARIQGSAETC